MAGCLASLFQVPAGGENGNFFKVVDAHEFLTLPAWNELNDSQPRGYLNYLLFDNDFILQDFGFDQACQAEGMVSEAAHVPQDTTALNGHDFEKLQIEAIAAKPGYVFIYASNEHEDNVSLFLDDMNVTHHYSDIVYAADYYPFGMPLPGREVIQENYRFKNSGEFAEHDEETGLTAFELRLLSRELVRWLAPDPARQYASPYVAFGNNPVNKVDPDGAVVHPVYGSDGEFRGVDEFGLQGPAIIYDGEFENGMSLSEILGNGGIWFDLAFDMGYFNAENLHISGKIYQHYINLPNRPDYDGFISIDEGIAWAKAHPGALSNPTADNMLYADAAKLDFGNISSSNLPLNEITPVNLFNNANTKASATNSRLRATVYALGRVNLKRVHGTLVNVINDDATDYDWNLGGSTKRKIAIGLERIRTGLNDSHGFKVFYYGVGRLNN